ncbi:MAG: acyl carrier protein [Chromatiaceae bacterium]|nr:acyl carrier protein [Gammaproteobacteria bacterium]MCP5300049.1 acyl carrier protein [Chromatiaceae bacterium]MCP5422121.1 acyl carrier protein [Chromatiaceae bacterium]
MSQQIEDYIVTHIAERRGIAEGEVDRQADMFENGYIDSLAVFNMILLLEERFGVRLTEQTLVDPSIYTVHGLAATIGRQIAGT